MKTRFFLTCTLMVLVTSSVLGASDGKTWYAPEFTAHDINDNVVSLAAFRGQVVVLHFWATWCSSCRREMPSLEDFANKYAQRGVVVLAITAEGSKERLLEYFEDRTPSYTVLMDKGSKVTRLYRVNAIPITLLVDRTGMVVVRYAGGVDWQSKKILADIEKLLEK